MECFLALILRNIKLFSLFGIDCSVNASVVALPVLIFSYGGLGWDMTICLVGVEASMFLHEMGHALGGYLVGNPAREICLTGFGGYTLLSNRPGATGRDAVISILGPLANAMMVLLLMGLETCLFGLTPLKWLRILLLQVFGNSPSMHFLPESYFIINAFAIFNLYVFLFNLLPAFPLDGGRVVRWFLGRFLCPLAAAKVTMFVSRACACLVIVHAIKIDVILDWDPIDLGFLLLVSAWIWLGSLGEVWRTEELYES